MKKIFSEPSWEELDDEQRRNTYLRYVYDVKLEHGDDAMVKTYDEWCKASEEFGQPLI